MALHAAETLVGFDFVFLKEKGVFQQIEFFCHDNGTKKRGNNFT